MKDGNSNGIFIIAGLAITIAFVFFFRFLGPFLIAVLILGLLFGGYQLIRILQKKRQRHLFDQTSEGKIVNRIAYCKQEIDQIIVEVDEIKGNMRDLENRIGKSKKVEESVLADSRKLLEAFDAELQLRRTKMSFFESCIAKLETLLQKIRLAKEVSEKKERLRQLQEEHFEELASLEELKTEVEMDVLYLDTIENLSRRIQESSNVDDALLIQRQLEEMTNDLKN